MKLRHPLLLRIAGFFAALLLRLWFGTLRPRYRSLDGVNRRPIARRLGTHCLYPFWHEYLLAALSYSFTNLTVLISTHADGELITSACRQLGYRCVRGSTTRNSIAALRELLRAAQHGHIVVTPDGPKGPRRRLQAGLIYLAARTGLPIVPVGLGCRRAWRLNSWDRFVLPVPFSDVWCVMGAPIFVPADIDRAQLEAYRQQVEAAVTAATAEAERLATRGDIFRPEGDAAAVRAA